MTDTPHADALLTALISGVPQIEAFADLADEHEREKALHVLLALLSDPDQRLRVRAIKAMAALGDQRAVEPLRESLDSDGYSTDVFTAMTEALVDLGDLEAVLPLLLHPWVIHETHMRLMRLNVVGLLRVLSDAFQHPDTVVRELVFQFVSMIGDPRTVPFYIQALEDESMYIRHSAVASLSGVSEAIPFLLPLTSDAEAYIRARTVQTLGASGDPRMIPG